jgi:opacity protein-like surface antigen
MHKALLTLLVLAAPALANAQGNRAGDWEWSFAAIYQDSNNSGGSGGSSLSVDSDWGLGVGFNYNFNNRFALGVDLEWLTPDYTAVIVEDVNPPRSQTIRHELSQLNGRIKGTWNIMEGPFTPYVEVGIGWTYLDSNVADGPPSTGCWWHPWWDYICSSFWSTYDTTEFSYGGALGLRYIMRGGMMLKLSYNNYELDTGGDRANPTLNAARLEVGWTF